MEVMILNLHRAGSGDIVAGFELFWSAFLMHRGRFHAFRRHLSCVRLQATHSQQVVGGADDIGMLLYADQTPHKRATQASIGLHPAEYLFDTLSLALADPVAGMPLARMQAASWSHAERESNWERESTRHLAMIDGLGIGERKMA